MGFPLGYTELLLPKLLFHALCLLGLIRRLVLSLFRLLGLPDFLLEPPDVDSVSPRAPSPRPPDSARVIREMLPVVKFESLADPPESCAVCLYEFEGGEEVRYLDNCRHVFHRVCLDRWMECDQDTCPLCRARVVPDDMREEFVQRLQIRAGSASGYGVGVGDFV